MTPHGQLNERAERIQKTRQWLGASPMTDFGEVIAEDTGEFEICDNIVQQTVAQIKCAIESGHGCVRVGERHRLTCEAIIAALTPKEREHVIFDLDNIMPPQGVEVVEQTKAKYKRDIVRPTQPNVVRVEDGSLRPS